MNFSKRYLIGAVFIIIGLILLAETILNIDIPFGQFIVPIVFITLGLSFFLPKDK